MTPVRWSFPEELDAHEASFDDEPFGADALAVEATERVAISPLRPFVEAALEFAAGFMVVALLIMLVFSFLP